jgi:hypothetical protein
LASREAKTFRLFPGWLENALDLLRISSDQSDCMHVPKRNILLPLGGLAVILLLLFWQQIFAVLFPRANFERISGYPLPSEVRVVKFKIRVCDNLFKNCYYWILDAPADTAFTGPPGSIISNDFDGRDAYRSETLEVLEPSMPPEEVPTFNKFYREGNPSQFLFRRRNSTRCYYLISTL